MTDFHDQDLSRSTFLRVDLSGAQFRGVLLNDTRWRGVELVNADIHGEIENVRINGVDIGPLVDAELNRRNPERAKMRPTDAAGFREAWVILERLWAETVARARRLPEPDLHSSVDGEWSFIQTLRHLNFASDAWVARMVLGDPSPWHPLDLPWDEAPDWDDIPRDREARPSMEELLAVRRERQSMVRGLIENLTDAQLGSTVSRGAPGWPQAEDFSLKECLLIVLNEEWEHRGFAERDLTALGAPTTEEN